MICVWEGRGFIAWAPKSKSTQALLLILFEMQEQKLSVVCKTLVSMVPSWFGFQVCWNMHSTCGQYTRTIITPTPGTKKNMSTITTSAMPR